MQRARTAQLSSLVGDDGLRLEEPWIRPTHDRTLLPTVSAPLKPKRDWVTLRDELPTVMRLGGFNIVIHVNDHPPANVHVLNADGECRIVLEPEVVLDRHWHMKAADAREAVRLVREHRHFLRHEWEKIHGTGE